MSIRYFCLLILSGLTIWHQRNNMPATWHIPGSEISYSNTADTIFLLKGRIAGQKKGTVRLIYTDKNGAYIVDSCRLRNGRFTFRGTIAEPTKVYLEGNVASKDMNDPNFTSFFVEPAKMEIELTADNFKMAVITGSRTQDEQVEYDKAIAPVLTEMQPLSKEFEIASRNYRQALKAKKDETTLEELKNKAEAIRTRFEPYTARIREIEMEYFRKNPESFVTAFQLRFHVAHLPLDSLQKYYDRLGFSTRQSTPGRLIAQQLEKLRAGWPGSIAKNFASTDIEGNALSLADFKGRYVLLDFWASWCVPCRKGNPHLKDLYQKYKGKGIEFIGIADDDRETDKWKQAVNKDGIGHWKHILRGLKQENNMFDHSNDISDQYGIHMLPTRILIDPQGKIIGRFGEDDPPLDEMLRVVFGY